MKKKNPVGRPSKVDKEAMNEANIMFLVIIIILLLLLSTTIVTIIRPDIFDMIKASIFNLFK